jgi:RNA-directed DNA polymerase
MASTGPRVTVKCEGSARIVKATREGRSGKVKALQWMLTHSFSGKALAVRRVTENQSKKTPGVDSITWFTPEAKFQAILSLKRHGYRPQSLRRIYIPKANGKMRPLGIPTLKDRAMQALYLLALEPVAETTADGRSFGFRPERSTADAMEQYFKTLSRKVVAPQWILEGDIKGCFDNISHDWLLANIPTDRTILKKWLKAGCMEDRQLFPTEAGTPQGGIISPTLANFVWDGLEAKPDTVFGRRRYVNGKQTRLMVNDAICGRLHCDGTLERATGARGHADHQGLHAETGADALTGEDQDHAH